MPAQTTVSAPSVPDSPRRADSPLQKGWMHHLAVELLRELFGAIGVRAQLVLRGPKRLPMGRVHKKASQTAGIPRRGKGGHDWSP